MDCNILKFKNNLEDWVACIGILDGRPYEIFTGKIDDKLSEVIKNVKKSEIVKVISEVEGERTKRYDLEVIDIEGNKKVYAGLSTAFKSEYFDYAKLFSGLMRHGMPIVSIIEQAQSLTLKDDIINTWKNGLIRALKKYVKDGEKGNGKCPNCGSGELEYMEGCLTCKNCGSSKCN